ncbi:MAG TPA: DUF1269 domain-containing protein [Ktedonobacterales bacterium]|nr:DUF1269 domain-containing protein [Ktedonobacterales bacterium]
MAGSMPNKNKELVLGLYSDLIVARQAQKSLDVWDKAEESIKLGSMAVIYKGSDSKLHWERSGVKDWKKSALVGGIAGLIFAPGVLVLAGLGAAFGAIDTKRIGVPKEDIEQIGAQLDQGKAALAVLCDDYEILPLTAEMTRLGGKVTHYAVPNEVVSQSEKVVTKEADAGRLTPDMIATTSATTPPPTAPGASPTTPPPTS